MNKPPSDPNANKNAAKAKAPKPEEPKEPAEDSVPLRIVVFLMAIVCVGASCILSHSSWMLTGLYLLLVTSGSFLSYQHRHDELKWLHWLALAGILFVGAGVLKEFMNPLRDEFDFVSPFIHFLAGVFAFITFEMRSRSDLNLSSTMGLLLLLLIAPVEKGLPLLAVILIYIILGSFMLYFDCLSESSRNRQQKPIAKAPEVKPAGVFIRRRSAGHTIPALMLVPLLSVVAFMFGPRSDDLLDRIMAAGKSFDPGILVSNMTPPPPPAQRKLSAEEQERARAWFQKKHGLSKIDPKDKNFKKRNASEDVDYVPPPPAKKGAQAKPQTQDSKKSKKGEEQEGENETPPPPEKNSQENQKKNKKNKGKNSASSKEDSAEENSGAKDKPGSPGGNGKNKRKRGKGSPSDTQSGSGNGNNGDFVIDDTSNLSLADKMSDRSQIVLVVKSRRIVYFRRRCYDVYSGYDWQQSDESKVEPVKVTNGEIKKEFKVNYAPPPTAPRYTPPPQNLLAPKQNLNGGSSGALSIGGPSQTSGSSNSGSQNNASSTSAGSQDAISNSAHMRPFKFQDQDKPLYRVSMADALKIPANFPSIELMQEMKVKAKNIGKYVPGAWIPQEVRLFNTTMTVDSMGAISAAKDIEQNTEFKVKTQLPMYDINALRLVDPLSYQEEESMREEFANYLELPKSLPQSVFELAEQKTNPQYNWFVQCEQITDYLRKNFKYNAMREVDEDADDFVADFLFKRKVGHCSDFASAFVVMARCVGIPARLVTGFGPGTLNNVSGEREIKASDLYTWAEAYIPETGWVPFDPSPEGFLPDVKKNDETTIDQVKETLGLDKEDQEEQAKILIARVVDTAFFGLGIIIVLVVLALCLRFLIPLLKKIKKSPYKRGPEWAVLLKVQKAIEQKLKQPRLPSETPLDFIERLRHSIVKTKNTKYPIPRDLPETLNRFYKAYSEVYFGGRKEKLDDVKEYGKQVIGMVSGKAPAEKKQTPPRGKRKGADSKE